VSSTNHVNHEVNVNLSSSTSSLTSTDTLPVKEELPVQNHTSPASAKEDTPPPPPIINVTAATPAAKQPAAPVVEEHEAETDSDAAPAPLEEGELPVENGTADIRNNNSSQIKLKYNYKEGQWSPCNPEGKKQYDRDFLYDLAKDPKSLVKPTNLPQMDIIKDKANIAKISTMTKTPGDFMPTFIKQAIQGRAPSGSMTKRGSRDGRDQKRPMGGPGGPMGGGPQGGQRVLNINIPSMNVELHKTDNAWKPGQKADVKEEEDPLADVAKQTLAILNKLTPQKFDKLIQKFNEITIDTEAKLRKCIDLIFEKAVDEPGFSVEYAKMCKHLNAKQVKENDTVVNFRKLLITRCQIEFQKDYMEGMDPQKLKEEIAKAGSEDEKKKLQDEFAEKEKKARRRSSGNTRFIGELYKLEMLTVRIMHECIRGLLRKEDEESLECLCTLVSSIGKVLEESTAKQQNSRQGEIVNLDIYFRQMKTIIDQKKTSTRVRCLLMDLIELRQNNWIPRRKVAGPKTIDQIHKDIQTEKNKEQLADLAYQAGGPSKSLGGNYGRDNRDNRRGGQDDGRKKSSQRMDQDGWQSTPLKTGGKSMIGERFDHKNNPFLNRGPPGGNNPFEQKKDSGSMSLGMGAMRLGGSVQQNSWGKGSGSKMSNSGGGAPSANRFDLLQSERSASPGPGGRMASRSVQGNMGGGSRFDNGRNEALQAVKNFGKQSVPNGPLGSVPPFGPPSVSSATMRLEIGPPDQEIERKQRAELQGGKGRFANLDNEDIKEGFVRRITNILKEYIHSPDVKEALLSVKEDCQMEHMAFCVETWIVHALESKAGSRDKLGYLITLLVKELLLQRNQVFIAIQAVLEVAEDLCCDIGPKFWDYLGELIAPLLESRLFAMNILPETASKLNEGVPCEMSGKYVEAVLRLAVAKINKVKVQEMWNEAGLSWKQFLPEDKIDDFLISRKIKENFEFTLSSTPSSSSASNSSSQQQDPSKMSQEQLYSTLEKMLDHSTAPPNQGAITSFVEDYVKTCHNGEPDEAFIRLATRAVAKSCLDISKQDSDPSQQSIRCTFQDKMFEEKAWFLKRLLDGKEDRQIQSLYAMVTLMIELEHPSKLLLQIFEALHSNDLVSTETFLAWEKDKTPAHQEGKGVAIKSTQSFFVLIKEDIEDDDEESDDD